VGAPEGAATEQARLLLARASRTVLANGLALLGITAPDRM
jgi:arginyl-tRNA synthetase